MCSIFSDSLQAVADSVYYSGLDSIFRLYTNPVAWAGGYQVTGDTMFLYTKNKKPERLYVFENSLVVGKSNINMYNQIKGNTLTVISKTGLLTICVPRAVRKQCIILRTTAWRWSG